ncbi:MAG: TrbG/VirB9 family P-type conjugative transfer protein [Rickettsiaceae bacterium H1]|nr:TrbG/VirB9 family P-type conjugative transfer protein [Rickettsiaceae bacterium H1]
MENKMKFLFLLLILFSSRVNADEQLMQSSAKSPHIKSMNYDKDNIHKYVGFYGYQSSIIFDNDETISTVSMGVSTGWQLDPQGNKLYIKPIEDNADTNASITTNKRTYHFKLFAKEAEGIDDPEIAHEVRFSYPEDNIIIVNRDETIGDDSEIPDIENATNLNFNYRVSGSDYIKPIRAFDNGKFTYLQFNNANGELPAVFLVDSKGYESLVNFRVRGDYMIIERAAAKFTLRNGDDTVCLSNKNIPYHYIKNKKSSLFG